MQILTKVFFFEGEKNSRWELRGGIPLPLNDVNSDIWCWCGGESGGVRNQSVFDLTFEEAGTILKNSDVTHKRVD